MLIRIVPNRVTIFNAGLACPWPQGEVNNVSLENRRVPHQCSKLYYERLLPIHSFTHQYIYQASILGQVLHQELNIQQQVKNKTSALAGVAQWLSAGLWTKGSLVDSQSGHTPGLRARSPVGNVQEATTHWCFSPFLSPSFPCSLKIINKIFKKAKTSLHRNYIPNWTRVFSFFSYPSVHAFLSPSTF